MQDPSSLPDGSEFAGADVSLPTLRLSILHFCPMPAILPFFLKSFTKSLKTLFVSVKAGSEIMGNDLVCGGERLFLVN